MRILLIGMMAVGKSTVGRAVSELTGWPYVDNDEVVRSTSGRSAAAVLEQAGVAALRRAESEALDAVLALPTPLVAGVAAGTIEEPDARRRMGAGSFVVHLRAPLDLLAERIRRDEADAATTGGGRPWIDDDPAAMLARLHRGRAELYVAAADLVIDVEGRTPSDVATEIASAVGAGRDLR